MRIMFVCHGNICRSPMAEFIFKSMLRESGLEDSFTVASSATSGEEIYRGIGNPVYPKAAATLDRHGIPRTPRRATRLVAEDYDRYDLFVGMDSANVRNMRIIFGSDGLGKIRLLKDYTVGGDVYDPWYTDDFETAYADIRAGCAALLREITK